MNGRVYMMNAFEVPFISVIVAVFNAEKTIQRCVDSVANQTYKNIELIIIDGESTDETVDIIKSNKSHISYWESSADTGIYDAWNKGVSRASGEWVCFLGADDYLWNTQVLEKMSVVLHNAYPVYRIVYGTVMLVNEDDALLYSMGRPWCEVKERFQQLMSVPHPGLMHHRTLFEDYGLFDDCFKIAGDYDFLLRELSQRDALFVEDLTVAGMQEGGVSSDPAQSLRSLQEVRISHRKLGRKEAGLFWWAAYIKIRVRMFLWKMFGESVTRYLLDIFRICTGHAKHWTKTK